MNFISLKKIPGWVWAIIVFTVGVSVYLNTSTHGFVYDDGFFSNVSEYRSLSSIPVAFTSAYNADAPMSGLYRPVPTLTFIITYALFGESAMPFHIGNILLHGIVSSLIFWLLAKVLKCNRLLSMSVALVFAVLPIHTEVVANIKSRDELLYACFFLLLWIFYEKGKYNRWWYGLSAVCWLLALLSKEMAVVSPLILIINEFIRSRSSWKRILVSLLWYVPIVFVYGLLRFYAHLPSLQSQFEFSYGNNPLIYLSPALRILSGFKIIALYMEKTFFPFYLSATYHIAHFTPVNSFHDFTQWLPGVIIVASMIGLAYKYRERHSTVLLGVVLFLCTYLPVSQFFFPAGDVVAERWMYVPSLGVILVLFYILFDLLSHKKLHYILVIGIVCSVYSVRTIDRNRVWASNATLFYAMAQDAPRSYRGHFLLSRLYLQQPHKIPEAKNELANAAAMMETPEVHNTYALLALMEGNIASAHSHLQKSKQLDPQLVATERVLTQVYYQQKDYEQAYLVNKKIMDAGVYRSDDIFFHATILAKRKQWDEAQQWISKVIKNDPTNWQPQYLQAVIWYNTGRKKDALNVIWNKSLTDKQRLIEIVQF